MKKSGVFTGRLILDGEPAEGTAQVTLEGAGSSRPIEDLLLEFDISPPESSDVRSKTLRVRIEVEEVG